MSWHGDNPYFLMIVPTGEQPVKIDLDERGWSETYAAYMRTPGSWYLCVKDGLANPPLFAMTVREGEQPYYTRRTVGVAGSGGSNSVAFYGIGKKRLDGHVDRLWVGPGHIICAGDDAEELGIRMVHRMGPKQLEEVNA